MTMKRNATGAFGRLLAGLTVVGTLAATAFVGVPAANAYTPLPTAMYQMASTDKCNKGGSNSGCIVYPKSAQLPGGRLVATFERSIGDPVGETMWVYASDDKGDNWNKISEVKSPHDLEPDNPAYAEYVSNWTNPYLYVMPETVGGLKAGTLLLASVVTGDDAYYKEHLAADPNYFNPSDGDRKDMAIALYSSTDEGVTWKVEGIVGEGGWQGGSARAGGKNIAAENTYKQIDPVWEPYLMVYGGKLVCYYSDENDYVGFDASTGVAKLRADNATAKDSGGQVLLHRTWDGNAGSAWSAPVIDVAGKTQTVEGQSQIGNGRPGMTNVVPTTDGKWMITYEDWGGNGSTKYKIADNPLEFYKVNGAQGPQGTNTNNLPVVGGGHLSQGGSPVLARMPDGSLIYNASGSGNIYVNRSGRSDGEWTGYRTSVPGGYSRNLQYVKGTGRILILHCGFSGSSVEHADVELGYSEAPAEAITFANGKVLGTGADDREFAKLQGEDPLASDNADAKTQQWHLTDRGDGTVALVNKSSGRVAAIDGGDKTGVILWYDENAAQDDWEIVADKDDASVRRIQSVSQPDKYLTIGEDGIVSVQPFDADNDGQRLAKAEKPDHGGDGGTDDGNGKPEHNDGNADKPQGGSDSAAKPQANGESAGDGKELSVTGAAVTGAAVTAVALAGAAGVAIAVKRKRD